MAKLSCQQPSIPSPALRQRWHASDTALWDGGVLLAGWHRKHLSWTLLGPPSHPLSTELEKQLVALIPYGDQRLKPRHT